MKRRTGLRRTSVPSAESSDVDSSINRQRSNGRNAHSDGEDAPDTASSMNTRTPSPRQRGQDTVQDATKDKDSCTHDGHNPSSHHTSHTPHAPHPHHTHHHTHGHRNARVYKRWVLVSSLLTFVFAWTLFPFVFEYRPQLADFAKLSEALFEREIFSALPGGSLFGEQFKMRLLSPFSSVDRGDGESSPGVGLRKKGAHAHFPVILIPGVTSTGLEIWEGKPCASSLFRQRLWGTLTMLRTLLMDKECWIEHLRVDPTTGRDPPGVRIRAAQGLEAADFIFPGFWVWARMIANLAEIGYDHNNLHMAAYDWRLDLKSLQDRDHYFSRLKSSIEEMRRAHGRKVVIIAHSLGSTAWLYFQKWVEADPARSHEGVGGRDPRRDSSSWIAEHVEAFVNIGGPTLGAPKSISTIMSGETRDTAQMNTLESYLLELLLNKQERLSLFRTWMGGFAIFPKGGTRIWGSAATGSPDAPPGVWGFDLVRVKTEDAQRLDFQSVYSYDQAAEIQQRVLPRAVFERYMTQYSTGIASPAEIARNDLDYRKWTNPLEARLPPAPAMKIYCLYGIGHETERSYVYKSRDPLGPVGDRDSLDPKKLALPLVIDLQEERREEGLYTGIHHVDGDGTVPLLSLSYMCTHAWRQFPHLNPSGMHVVTREYKHDPVSRVTDLRGGPATSDHVDILGNHDLTEDILRIVANFHESGHKSERPVTLTASTPATPPEMNANDPPVSDRILSNIHEIAKRVNLHF